MERNKTKAIVRLIEIIFILMIVLFGYVLYNLIDDNNDLQNQVEKRDKLIEEMQDKDSLFKSENKKNKDIITKYISDCGILINGKKVSTDQLLQFLNNQIKENESLRDSLSIYKSFYELAKKNYGADYKIKDSNDRRVLTMVMKNDSSEIYKALYQQAQRDYGIKYNIEQEDDGIYFTKNTSKADSALILFKYYKDKIKRDSAGNWIITLPPK